MEAMSVSVILSSLFALKRQYTEYATLIRATIGDPLYRAVQVTPIRAAIEELDRQIDWVVAQTARKAAR